ncbi:MAG: Hsp20/alpha crystallin family protein [Thermodesulfovibrionales bacterium]
MKGTKDLVKAEPSGMLSPLDEMERWFETMWSRPFSLLRAPLWTDARLAEREVISPSVDVYEEGNELIFKADMPGVTKEDLKVDIAGDYLTISGEKKKEEKIERKNYYRFERSHGSFSRRFELPAGVDTDKVKAHFEGGVLEVRIPKTEEAVKKSKKILID